MTENDTSPKLVVLTPVRNEAWVLRGFLEATSLWADYIIIADQMSNDGSRDIAREYPKVILIDNDREEMHMAATRRLLFEEARKIKGEKINESFAYPVSRSHRIHRHRSILGQGPE